MFSVSDTIPFHLQLRGQTRSLLKLLGIDTIASATALNSPPSLTATSSISPSTSQQVAATIRHPVSLLGSLPHNLTTRKNEDKKSSVRVYLHRCISARIDGQRVGKNIVVGEAHLSLVSNSSPDPELAAFDWDGEVRPESIKVGSFSTDALHVKVRRVFVLLTECCRHS